MQNREAVNLTADQVWRPDVVPGQVGVRDVCLITLSVVNAVGSAPICPAIIEASQMGAALPATMLVRVAQ
jgi:hypothetical protein